MSALPNDYDYDSDSEPDRFLATDAQRARRRRYLGSAPDGDRAWLYRLRDQALKFCGAAPGGRTLNQRIKSPLLCH